MQTGELLKQIDALLREVDGARVASDYDDLSGGLADDQLKRIETRLMSAIERLAPAGSSYLTAAKKVHGYTGHNILELGGILEALRDDFEDGYIRTVEELIRGSVFDDFLEMATELLSKEYKDPAAVIAGSVLEEHIRKLSSRNDISLTDEKGRPVSFDALTINLVKVGQFSEPQRKILAGWYGVRSAAAHSDYANVIKGDVSRMIEGIREFMVRFPA